MTNSLPTLAECRSILGASADSLTDERVLAERDHLAELANVLFDQFRAEARRDPEAMRHLLDAHRNGVGSDTDLYMGEYDPNEWALSANDGIYTDETLALLRARVRRKGDR